jgi:hypothetical protein
MNIASRVEVGPPLLLLSGPPQVLEDGCYGLPQAPQTP